MAFENFWKRDRERHGGDRNREDWRSRGGEWREAVQGRGQQGYGRGMGGGEDQEFGRRGWREGSDYYGNRDESYSGRGQGYGQEQQQDFGRHGGRESSRGQPRDERMSYGEYSGSGFGENYGGRGYGGTGGGRYGGDWNEDTPGGSFGSGGYGRDTDYGRRGALGYGGYGGMGGGETGSSMYGQMGQGEHRGRGPRGYQRSDDRLREDICDMLTDDAYIDASNMEVTVKEGEVTLSGSVNSREDKRRAEDLAERVSGVKDVHNSLRVSSEQRGMGQMGTQSSAQSGTQSTSTQAGTQSGSQTGQSGTSGQTSRH